MQTMQPRKNEVAIWARLFDQEKPKLSPDAARAILELEFPQEDRERMHELAAKARGGELSPEEQEEADSYGFVGSLLSIPKSKTRQALKRNSNRNGTRLGKSDSRSARVPDD